MRNNRLRAARAERDMSQAAELYEAAAQRGVPEAMEALSQCYARGDGLSQNEEEAEKWRRLAAWSRAPETDQKDS